FKNTHPGFYAGYGQARTIVDAATRPTAISLQVLDARTEAPLAGARITLGSLELTTNERGRFTLKDIEPGTHTIRVGKEGYGEKMVEGVEVKVGKTKKVKVGLEAR
ncbi:MAG: PEGA domain-containing protein, partial [Chitinophagaceae bacterium]